MTGFDIYLFTRLDSILGVATGAFIISVIALITGCFFWFYAAMDGDIPEALVFGKRLCKRAVIVAAVAGLILTIVPSTKEYAAIYLIPRVVNNEQAQKVPDKAMELLNAKLQEWINDSLKKEKK